jgi:hypothetical protein
MESRATVKEIRRIPALVLVAGPRPENATKVIQLVEDTATDHDVRRFLQPEFCRLMTSMLDNADLPPEEQLRILLQEAEHAGRARFREVDRDVRTGDGGNEVNHVKREPRTPRVPHPPPELAQENKRSIIDLTSDVQPQALAYFQDPVASLKAGKEVPESADSRALRMALANLVSKCVLPNHPSIITARPLGDVAGVFALLRGLGVGHRAAQMLAHVRWLVNTNPQTEGGLAPYLDRLNTTVAFLNRNGTGAFCFGTALALESVLQAAHSVPALSAELALARRDGTDIAGFTRALTALSVSTPAPLSANVAVGARGLGGGRTGRHGKGKGSRGRGAAAVPSARSQSNPVMREDLPASSCFAFVRSGVVCASSLACPFKHDQATRASYLNGTFRCANCETRHVPRHCPPRPTANVAEVDAAHSDAADLECSFAEVDFNPSGLEVFY